MALFEFLLHKRLITFVSIVLLALLAYQVALSVWSVYMPAEKLTLNESFFVEPQNTEANKKSTHQLVREILTLHPFGQKQSVVAKTQTKDVIVAPQTQLKYKLRGLYYSQDKHLSSAIIETSAKNSLSYQLDDVIEDGITVHDIQLDHIVINRYGKYETLSLEQAKFDARNRLMNISTNNSDDSAKYNEIFKKYRKRFVNNPMVLARKFRAIPVSKNGRNIGFKLQALRGEVLLKQLDVDKDSIFTAINGVGLDKPFQALDALKSIQTAKKVDVTYLLNGTEQTRSFELQ
ncbi:MAG: hypothetical protein ISR69_01755 [Gammaproteobacteria bacterium]|nr:hypothetical protein [Gammaproteobacteria bacterium]